jgi:flagellar basal body P-ring protein FlgI
MKLDKTQINALAAKIAREINEERTAQYNKLVDAKIIELQDKLDHDFIVLDAALSKLPIKTKVEVIIEYPNGSTYCSKGNKVSRYIAQQFFKSSAVLLDRIKEDLILETIGEHENLQSLITTIKQKYVN